MWVPIDDAAARWLPSTSSRPFTHLEALYCLQRDYRDRRPASARGYEVLWRWGRRRVVEFLEEVGVEIVGQKGRKPGYLQPQHRNDTTNDTTNDTVTTPQIFCDLGQIGNFGKKNDTANDTDPRRKKYNNYREEKEKKKKNQPPYPPEWLGLAREAMRRQVEKGKEVGNGERYLAGIITKWLKNGGPTPDEVISLTPSWQNKEVERTRKYLENYLN